MPGYYFAIEEGVKLNTDSQLGSSKADTGENNVQSVPSNKSGLLIDEFENSIKKGCVQCPIVNGIKSCALCYPKNPEFCLLCNSGFTHDSDGKCTQTEQDTTKTDDNIGVSRFKVSVIFGVLIMTLFRY